MERAWKWGMKKIGGRLLVGTWKVLGMMEDVGGESAWVGALQSCGGMWACKVRVKCVESSKEWAWKVRGKLEGVNKRKVG